MYQNLQVTNLLNHFIKKSLARGEMLALNDGLRQKIVPKKFHDVLPKSIRNLAKPLRKMVKKSMNRASIMSEENGLGSIKN